MFHKCALPLLDDTTCKTSVQFDFAVKKRIEDTEAEHFSFYQMFFI